MIIKRNKLVMIIFLCIFSLLILSDLEVVHAENEKTIDYLECYKGITEDILIKIQENSVNSTDDKLFLFFLDINFDSIPELIFYSGGYSSASVTKLDVYSIVDNNAKFLYSDDFSVDSIKLYQNKSANDKKYLCSNGRMGWVHDYEIGIDGLTPLFHINYNENKYYIGKENETRLDENEITEDEYKKYYDENEEIPINIEKHYLEEISVNEIVNKLKNANNVYLNENHKETETNKEFKVDENNVYIENSASGTAILMYTTKTGEENKIVYEPKSGVGRAGEVKFLDLNGDNKNEIIVNLSYVGSTYGATDIYIYNLEDSLEELLYIDQDNISRYDENLYACNGVIIVDNDLIVCAYSRLYDPGIIGLKFVYEDNKFKNIETLLWNNDEQKWEIINEKVTVDDEKDIEKEVEKDTEKRIEIFEKDKNGVNKYNGNKINKGESYAVYGDTLIDREMEIGLGSKIYVDGDLTIDNVISLSGGSKQKDKNTIVTCSGNLIIKSKGIIDLSKGGTLQTKGDFIFNSSIEHDMYLRNGQIEVSGDVNIKRNFYASEKNNFQIISNGKDVHKIEVNKNWFKPLQTFGVLHIVGGGCENLDLKQVFNYDNIIFDNWDILKQEYYGNCLNLMYNAASQLGKKAKQPPEYVLENIQSGLMIAVYNSGIKIPFVNEFKFKSVNKEGVEFYYYDKESEKIEKYTLDINYFGIQMGGTAGYGSVVYKDDKNTYRYVIGINKDTMEKLQDDFIKTVKNTYVDSIKDTVIQNLHKSRIKSELFSDFYDLMGDIKEVNELSSGDNSASFLKGLIDNKDNIKRYRNLLQEN